MSQQVAHPRSEGIQDMRIVLLAGGFVLASRVRRQRLSERELS